MSRRPFILIPVFILIQLFFSNILFSQSENLQSEFKARRLQVMSKMDTNSVAIFRSAEEKVRSYDVNFPFRQESNFLYLTGHHQPGVILILIPRGFELGNKKVHEIFFSSSQKNVFTTPNENTNPESSTYDTTLSMEYLETNLKKILAENKTLYYNLPQPSFYHDPISGKRIFIEKEIRKELTQKYPEMKIRSIGNILSELRMIKSPQEIACLQKAIDITASGLREAIRSAEPGMYEYQLEAILEYIYRREGASGPAFTCIIGSGPNSLILHYDSNQRQMQAGDVVVMDVGGEYAGYSADITRTIPINGKFSQPQREIYELVLSAQKEAIKLMQPGNKTRAVETKVREVITAGLLQLGIMKEKNEIRKFLPHGVCHSLGLDTHDGFPEILEPGVVITIEPGIYIKPGDNAVPGQYWNIGIRIEDDILITENGNLVLSKAVPKEISEIKKLMKASGIGNNKKVGK
ncbi:aminopeptidase P N-terminal domain-containing protein [candidate division KSB1 bacterium]|nr:aminopeptidase P N-terminal domain-containing protein [candidate division KSB1 bacterium]